MKIKTILLFLALCITMGVSAQMRYHDAELNDAKGKVKSISTNSVVLGESKLITIEFTVDGKQKGVRDAEYDSNGYLIKSTNKNNEFTVTTKYIWENGRLIEAVSTTSINDITMSIKLKYNNKGEQIECAMDTFKYQYSDYKYDAKGNWISRKRSFLGQQETETRTIEYY
ncbi:MAG: hypothetical protein IKP30_01420 [Bacteroidaceae bacterium]|nr:hypothetical protein [Bacteroidaceae bacterium]